MPFSFSHGWMQVADPPNPAEVIEDNLDSWLQPLAHDGRVDELAQIGKQVIDLLAEAVEGV